MDFSEYDDKIDGSFYESIENNNMFSVRHYISKGEDLSRFNYVNMAIKCHHYAIAMLLIEHSVNIRSMNSKRMTLLHVLLSSKSTRLLKVEEQRHELAEVLFEKGLDIHQADIYGATPMHYAIISGHEDIANMFIGSSQTPFNEKTLIGNSALHMACWHAMYSTVCKLLESNGIEVDVRDAELKTSLHCVAVTGNVKIARVLISHGANIDAVNMDGDTALHVACKHDKPEFVEYLVENGCNTEIKNRLDKTADFEKFIMH